MNPLPAPSSFAAVDSTFESGQHDKYTTPRPDSTASFAASIFQRAPQVVFASSHDQDQSRHQEDALRYSMPAMTTTQQPMGTKIERALSISAQTRFTSPFPPECEPTPIARAQNVPSFSGTDAASFAAVGGVGMNESFHSKPASHGRAFARTVRDTMDDSGDEDSFSLDDTVSFASETTSRSNSSEDRKKKRASSGNAKKRSRCKSKKWGERLQDLISFKRKHGHCTVTNQNGNDPDLVQWIKRQRYHYKLRDLGKPSPILDSQIRQLDEIGFVWNSHGKAWDAKLKLLEDFRREHGHCRVPRDYAANPPLSTWVKRQRRLYKAGQVSPFRVARLEAMGFVWDPRNIHHKIKKDAAKKRP